MIAQCYTNHAYTRFTELHYIKTTTKLHLLTYHLMLCVHWDLKRCKVLELHVSRGYNPAISGTLIQIGMFTLREMKWSFIHFNVSGILEVRLSIRIVEMHLHVK